MDLKIAVLIPHRNDRPKFLSHLRFFLDSQTLKPDLIHFVDYKAETKEKDITQRYRRGYDFLRNKGIDVICLLEVDDWYRSDYIEIMVKEWEANGKPEIFGLRRTVYYHIGLKKFTSMNHNNRSSAFSTIIKADLPIEWCNDNEPFTDIYLWKQLKGKTFFTIENICLGIKHGEGLCGGSGHKNTFPYQYYDNNYSFLRSIVDKKSFDFYTLGK